MDLSCEEFCSCLFVRQSDNKRYKYLKGQQHNAFLVGDDKYTKEVVESKTLLRYWQGPTRAQQAPITNKEEDGGVAFVKQGKNAAVKKSPKVKCHGCGMVNDHFLSD